MVRIFVLTVFACALTLAVYAALTLYDKTLQVGRMRETVAVKFHEEPIPVTARDIVAFNGGDAIYRALKPEALKAPFQLNDAAAAALGKQGYQRYCVHCHGKNHDGAGTVGQSFAPVPGDLRSKKVQAMPEGRLFHEISYGIQGGRQPALATTVSADERWQIIAFIKGLGLRP
ncbi:MAG: c-type cytochrome [Desulfobacteraceae bacterium]|nr:c-type cytochrome [Desulfobacteraceae bacterium]